MSILNTTNVVTTTHLLFKCFYFWRGAAVSEEIWLKGKMALKNEELKWLVSDDELRYPKFSLDTINYSLYVNKFGHNSVISQWFKCNFFWAISLYLSSVFKMKKKIHMWPEMLQWLMFYHSSSSQGSNWLQRPLFSNCSLFIDPVTAAAQLSTSDSPSHYCQEDDSFNVAPKRTLMQNHNQVLSNS